MLLPVIAAGQLSSLHALSSSLSRLSVDPRAPRTPSRFVVRMGGGPRTFPGGVSKWQWKRMQAKKAKQLLKAKLMRERQLYDMRRRTELRAAVAELERPWDPMPARSLAPTLMSVSADEQVKALADRFHRPGGFDMWNDRDGPRVFRDKDGAPSHRFFPPNAVHSVKPYSVGEPRDQYGGKKMRPPWRTQGVGANASRIEKDGVLSQRFFPRNAIHSVKPYSVSEPGDKDDGKEMRPPRRRQGLGANASTTEKRSPSEDAISDLPEHIRQGETGLGSPRRGGMQDKGSIGRGWSRLRNSRPKGLPSADGNVANDSEEDGRERRRGTQARTRSYFRPSSLLFTEEDVQSSNTVRPWDAL